MSRRLVGAVVGGDARALAPPDPATDAFTAQRVAEASEAAYAQGLADGRRAAVGEASEAARWAWMSAMPESLASSLMK